VCKFEVLCSWHIAVLFLQFIRLTGRTTRFNYHIHFVFQELSRALVRRVIYIFAVANFFSSNNPWIFLLWLSCLNARLVR